MRLRLWLCFTFIPALALTDCARSPAGPQATDNSGAATTLPTVAADSSVPYETKLPLKELMGHVMQYAGDGIWKRQGSISDTTGEHDLYPKTKAEWEDAESASLALVQMTNVLLLPGRRVDEPNWTNAVLKVRAVAQEAADAAEAQDKDAFFKAGGELDEACESCHVHYMPDYIKAAAAAAKKP